MSSVSDFTFFVSIHTHPCHALSHFPLLSVVPSGTLAPCSQTGISHPRRGIAVILQILNDLLKAAHNHQGAPPTLPQCHSPTLNLPVSPGLTAEGTSRPRNKLLVTQRAEHSNKPLGQPDQILFYSILLQ